MANKRINSAELENSIEQSNELFPDLVKKPSAASSSGIRQADLIMQQGQKWYKDNVQIHDAARDTLTDEEGLQSELNLALENAQNFDNPEYLKSVFDQINNSIIIPALHSFNDSKLPHIEKSKILKTAQSSIKEYIKIFYPNEYRKHISIATLEECLLIIAPPNWKSVNCLIRAQNSLKSLLC